MISLSPQVVQGQIAQTCWLELSLLDPTVHLFPPVKDGYTALSSFFYILGIFFWC